MPVAASAFCRRFEKPGGLLYRGPHLPQSRVRESVLLKSETEQTNRAKESRQQGYRDGGGKLPTRQQITSRSAHALDICHANWQLGRLLRTSMSGILVLQTSSQDTANAWVCSGSRGTDCLAVFRVGGLL